MNDQTAFRHIAAISTIGAGLLQLASGIFGFSAIDFDFEVMADPASVLTIGGQAAETLRWGLVFELFGFFLLLAPAALYLWHWLRPHSPNLVNLFTVFGLASFLIGGAEAATRLGVLPAAINAYGQASGSEREMLAVAFQMFNDVYWGGLIVTVNLLLSAWLLGIGLMMRRERRAFGLFTAILGVGYFLSIAVIVFRIDQLAPVQGIFVLFPIWTLWLGLVVWRRAEQSDHVLQSAAAARAT